MDEVASKLARSLGLAILHHPRPLRRKRRRLDAHREVALFGEEERPLAVIGRLSFNPAAASPVEQEGPEKGMARAVQHRSSGPKTPGSSFVSSANACAIWKSIAPRGGTPAGLAAEGINQNNREPLSLEHNHPSL